MQVKRSKLSDREHQTSASFQMPTQHNLCHRRQENEDYGSPLKDRFSTSYSRRDSAFSTGRHGWGLQPENMNRCVTSSCVFMLEGDEYPLLRQNPRVGTYYLQTTSWYICTLQNAEPFHPPRFRVRRMQRDIGIINPNQKPSRCEYCPSTSLFYSTNICNGSRKKR